MAPSYTRLGQATGELRYVREWIARVPSRSATVRTTNPYTGNACLEVGSPSGSGFGFVIPQGAHTRGGGYFQYPSLGQVANDVLLLYFAAAGDDDYSHAVRFDYDNSLLELIIDGNVEDTATFAECGISPDLWIRFGWNFNPSDWFTFYIEGNEVLAFAGAVAQTAVVAVFTGNYSATGIQNILYFDDVYVDECSGELGAIVPPRKIFMAVAVEANGMFSDWTPSGVAQNYQAVDDPSTPDDDATHNYADSDGDRDTFDMTAFTTPAAGEGSFWRIASVIVQAVARKPNPGDDSQLSIILYDGLNTAVGTPHPYMGPDYLVFWDRFETEPDGSSWAEADVNGMEAGYRINT